MPTLHLVLVGDIHYGPPHFWPTVPGQEVPGLLDDFLATVNEEIKPDAVVELGDRIQTMDKQTDLANETFVIQKLDEGLTVPCYHVLGNHDVINLSRAEQNALARYPMGPSTCEVNGFRLILLNTLDPLLETMGGRIGEEQLEWLRQIMKEDDLPKLVFGHHPIDRHDWSRNRIIDRATGQYTFLENAEQVCSCIESGSRPVLYAGAHMHWFSCRKKYNLLHLVAPPFAEAHPDATGAPGLFFELTIDDEGGIAVVMHGLHPRRAFGRIATS